MFGGGGLFGRQSSADNVKLGAGITLLERLNAGQGGIPTPTNEDKKKSPVSSDGNDDSFSSKLSLGTDYNTLNILYLLSQSSTGLIKSASPDYGLRNNKNSSDNSSGSVQNTPRLNGGRDFASSPSASSVSQHGPGSSCGTSPEPMSLGNSNEQNTTSEEGLITIAPNGDRYICKSGPLDGETETTFCEKLGMACGNPHNPIPKAAQLNNSGLNAVTTNSLDWLTQQNGGNFDPVLFADYRDPVNEINAGINMSFFDDAFPMTTSFADIESPFGSSLRKKDLVPDADRAENGEDEEDEVVPADDPRKMLSCNKIWYVFHSHFPSKQKIIAQETSLVAKTYSKGR